MTKGRAADFESYCEAARPFARPILRKLRALWRQAAPEASEAMKWGSPCFVGKSLLGGAAAFQAHVSVWIWKGALNDKASRHFAVTPRAGMGRLKVERVSELPSDRVLLSIFREALRLDGSEAKAPRTKAKVAARPRVVLPRDLAAAMKLVPQAVATFQALSPSCRREYVEWVLEAKREATRAKRIATTVLWLAEGKDLNWRYR